MTISTPARLLGPGDLIAAIPAVLGFYPFNSFVAILMVDGVIACAMRSDVGKYNDMGALDGLEAVMASTGANEVAMVAVADARHIDAASVLVRAAAASLALRDVSVHRLVVGAIEAGAQFVNLSNGTMGTVPDPKAGVVMADALANGSVIAPSRDVAVDRFAVGDEISRDQQAATAEAMGESVIAATVEQFVMVVRGTSVPSTGLAARIGYILGCEMVAVRDCLAYAAQYDSVRAVDALVSVAARLRGAERAHALSLAALVAQAFGVGAVAGMAIEAAIYAALDEGVEVPSLTRLLDKAYTTGLPGSMFLECIPTRSMVESITGAVLPPL